MFPVVFIGLFVSVIAVLAVVCAMFFSVAFENQEQAMFSPSSTGASGLLRGRPQPPSSGSSLDAGRKGFFSQGAPSVTARCERQLGCQHSRDVIPVTAPEVFAIADFLKMSRTTAEVEAIYQSAERNDQQCTPGHLGCDQPSCPLINADGGCMVHPVRPQYCHRAEYRDMLLNGNAHEMTAHAGAFWNGISPATVPAARYELNSALIVALSELEGESHCQTETQLFASCRNVC